MKKEIDYMEKSRERLSETIKKIDILTGYCSNQEIIQFGLMFCKMLELEECSEYGILAERCLYNLVIIDE